MLVEAASLGAAPPPPLKSLRSQKLSPAGRRDIVELIVTLVGEHYVHAVVGKIAGEFFMRASESGAHDDVATYLFAEKTHLMASWLHNSIFGHKTEPARSFVPEASPPQARLSGVVSPCTPSCSSRRALAPGRKGARCRATTRRASRRL